MAFDYKKEYKEFYLPKNKPGLITVPRMNFVAVRGRGDPNEEGGAYKQAIGLLYGIAFTIKMSKKGDRQIEGYFDYVVPPLEGFWWQDGVQGIDYAHKETSAGSQPSGCLILWRKLTLTGRLRRPPAKRRRISPRRSFGPMKRACAYSACMSALMMQNLLQSPACTLIWKTRAVGLTSRSIACTMKSISAMQGRLRRKGGKR